MCAIWGSVVPNTSVVFVHECNYDWGVQTVKWEKILFSMSLYVYACIYVCLSLSIRAQLNCTQTTKIATNTTYTLEKIE